MLCVGFLRLQRAGTSLRCGAQPSHCRGFPRCSAWAAGARASVVVALGLSCSVACGILPDQGLNLCPLHWQADSSPLSYQGSLRREIFMVKWARLYCLPIVVLECNREDSDGLSSVLGPCLPFHIQLSPFNPSFCSGRLT